MAFVRPPPSPKPYLSQAETLGPQPRTARGQASSPDPGSGVAYDVRFDSTIRPDDSAVIPRAARANHGSPIVRSRSKAEDQVSKTL